MPYAAPRDLDLDDISRGFSGRSFADFVTWAREAQALHGYVPAPVPTGPSAAHREAAERFADALEAEGLRVGRPPAARAATPPRATALEPGPCAHCAAETAITLRGRPCCLDCLELRLVPSSTPTTPQVAAMPVPSVPSSVPFADRAPPPHAAALHTCTRCGSAEDPALLQLLSLGGERPVFCACGATLFSPGPAAPGPVARRSRVRTMGQAVDAALSAHASRCPGASVQGVRAREVDDDSLEGDGWIVEVDADHFSTWLVYLVPVVEGEPAVLLEGGAA